MVKKLKVYDSYYLDYNLKIGAYLQDFFWLALCNSLIAYKIAMSFKKKFCVKTHDFDLAWAGINLFLSLILWSKSLALIASLVEADVAGFLNDFPNLAFFCNPLDPIHWKFVIT